MNSAVDAARGWQARLALRFETIGGRTVLARWEHAGPMLVQRAFYPEVASGASASSPCHVYLIHPPGGIVSGDELTLEVEVGAGAHALLTTPAAGKFYRKGPAGVARARQMLQIQDGVLEWLPQENIFYPNAAVDLRSIVRLSGQARFIGWEIGCLGLPASARDLEQGALQLNFELWRQQQPLLLERLHVSHESPGARWGLGGHAVLGTLLATPAGSAELECVRAATAAD